MNPLTIERTIRLCQGREYVAVFAQEAIVHLKHLVKHVLNPREAWHELDPVRFPEAQLRTARTVVYQRLPRTIHGTQLGLIPDVEVMAVEPSVAPYAGPYAEAAVDAIAHAIAHSSPPNPRKGETLRMAGDRGLVVHGRLGDGKKLKISTVFRADGQSARERANRAVRKVLDVPSFYTTSVCRPPERQQAPHTTTTTIAGRPT